MDISLITNVLHDFSLRMVDFIRILQPVGEQAAGSFTVLAILMLGLNLIVGGSFVAPLVKFAGASAATFWAIRAWPEIVMGTIDSTHAILGLFFGTFEGPATLFQASSQVVNRLLAEPAAWSWTLSGTIGTLAVQMLLSVIAVVVAIGLSFPGLLSVLAELSLMLGAAAAPLILPAMAFDLTRQLGWGVVTFMVSAALKIVVLGMISGLFAASIQAQLALPGAGEVLGLSGAIGLLLTSMFALVAGVSGNSIAGSLVGGGVGGLGWSSVVHGGSVVQGSAVSAASGAMSAAGAAARSAGGPAGRAAGGMARAVGSVTSRSTGSAFGP